MRGRSGFSTVELIIASGVTILASLIVGLSITFFSRQASQQSVQIEQMAQAQAFLQLLRKDLASASEIVVVPPTLGTPTGFKLTQKILSAGKVITRDTIYTIGGPTTCTTSTKKSFACIRVQRKSGDAPVELPNVVAFRWCSEKLQAGSPPVPADCASLASFNRPLPATPARFIGQVEFLAFPERPAGQQTKTVSFVYEAANLGAKIQVLKTE